MARLDRHGTGGVKLLVAGGMALTIAAATGFIGILLSSDEPRAAKPWLIAAMVSALAGVGLLTAGVIMLLSSLPRGRRGG